MLRRLIGWARVWPAPADKEAAIPYALSQLDTMQGHATFVQIGSNDANHGDPLKRFVRTGRWTGLMVEPVPYLFDRLRRNYESFPGVRLECAAVAEIDGQKEFFYVPQSSDPLPVWYDQIGSFRLDNVLKHRNLIPDLERRVESMRVPCFRLASLLSRHNIRQADVLHIDAEGYDHEILKQVEFGTFRPRLIIYEHTHLSEKDATMCVSRCDSAGYTCFIDGPDTLAVDARYGLLHEKVVKAGFAPCVLGLPSR